MNQQQRLNMIENTFFYEQERVEELTNKTFTGKEWNFIKDELEDCIGTNLHEKIDELISNSSKPNSKFISYGKGIKI